MAPSIEPPIRPPGQYTHCVDRAGYREIPGLLKASWPAILEFLLCDYLLGGKLVCLADGQDKCVIGMVVGVEGVGEKTGFEAIDNDFSFNVLAAPYQPDDFKGYRHKLSDPMFDWHTIRDDVAGNPAKASPAHSPLGWLMVDPTPTPVPLPNPDDQTGTPVAAAEPRGNATWPLDGYGVLYKWNGSKLEYDGHHHTGDNLHKLWDQPPNGEWPAPPDHTKGEFIALPVVHAECEGSRIIFVCKALKPFLDILQGKPPGSPLPSPGEACHAVAKYWPWPIDAIIDAVCSVVEDIVAAFIAYWLSPYIAATLATAWEAAQIYDDASVTGPVAKQIHVGDVVIVSGRWTWDAGHSGHTELHPVKTIQKITGLPQDPLQLPSQLRPPTTGSPAVKVDYDPRKQLPAEVFKAVADTHEKWCNLVREAPPPPDPTGLGGALTGPQLGALTPAQLTVHTRQQQPENAWTIHPLIDGCAPPEAPPPPPRLA